MGRQQSSVRSVVSCWPTPVVSIDTGRFTPEKSLTNVPIVIGKIQTHRDIIVLFTNNFQYFRRFIQRFNMKQHIKTHRIELLAEQNGATALNFAQ